MRHRQAVHGQRRAGLPDEQRARHGRAGGQRRRRELRHGLALGLLMRSRLGLCATFLADRRLPVYIHHCVYEYQILHCVVFMKALTVGFTTDESSLCDQVQRCDFCWRRLLSYAQL